MEAGDKLKELDMTADEIDRMTKALKDEKFREMLSDYAEELSDPENKKRYEEELTLLEKERGNTIEFIHPVPFRAVKTSLNGKQKCFINICGNDKVGKPECKWGLSTAGHKGQSWSLPHSLHPGRENTNRKGEEIMIYDIVFHPDTLHIAAKDKRFMDMVESIAIEGIQKTFNVTLDKNNVRVLSTKYKGTPQPCVIRKPIPGHKIKDPSEKPDPLAFPYPDEKRPSASKSTNLQTKNNAELKSFQIQPQETKEPTRPNYTVKYRSFIDLQDFRYSRDSARSPRPKEIVVTINVPLLKKVTDASLEVTEKNLLLESKKPAYRLDLPLAYPVDEDKGEAKFNKQRGQLTVTLPVLPSDEALNFALGQSSVSDGELQEESKIEKSDECEKEERGVQKIEEEEKKGKEESNTEDKIKEVNKSEAEENLQQMQLHGRKMSEDGYEEAAENEDSSATRFEYDSVNKCRDTSPEKDENLHVDSPVTKYQDVLVTAEPLTCKVKEEEEHLESTNQVKTPDIKAEIETTVETLNRSLEVDTDAAFLQNSSSEEPQTTAASLPSIPATDALGKSSEGNTSHEISFSPEELSMGSVLQQEDETIDEDDLPAEGILQNPELKNNKLPPVLLREIDEDGNEKVISDHSTSAAFTFENSLMFELD
ncbi:protein kintoun [Xyrichtys novacula]|uniref:Protein kintoun n=1 Tax=Xyrichtys novacula TaxID=13765 RepID=A0AAV1GKH3_XYRNO|nr:protein kintoun [Xyrichtys novacula]